MLYITFHNSDGKMNSFGAKSHSDINVFSHFIGLYIGKLGKLDLHTFKELHKLYNCQSLFPCAEPPNPIIIDNYVVQNSVKNCFAY